MTVTTEPASGAPAIRSRRAPSRPDSLRAVVRRGLRDRARAVSIWGLSIGGYGAFMAAVYPSMQSSIEKMLRSYPAGLKEAFGAQSMNTVEGYLHAEMFSLIVPLALGYFAIRAVAGPTVGAEERGDLDTILSLPISRTVLLAGSYLVAALASLAIMIIAGALTFFGGSIAGTDISLGLVTAGVIGVWPLALLFAGLSALASGALHSSRTVNGVALGALVAMYGLDLAGRLAHSLAPIRWASAFRYYGAPMRDGIDPASFIGLAAVGAMLLIAGAALFERRDVLH
jgi:beta-exotoxin I transport system permease protein